MTRSLKGQVVLITGASSGFGADAARLFAKEGCSVVLAARRMDRLQALAEEIQAAGGEALAVPVDVNQQAEIEVMVKTVLDVYERIDILFNNAGFGRLDWLENLTPDRDIETQLDVNLHGVIQVTRAVLPHMYDRRSGHVINMASVAGLIAAPLYSIYSASKYGVRGFTDALRREAAPLGVRVSGVYPGPAATEFSQHTGDNTAKRTLKLPRAFSMTAGYVAGRVVALAKRPRRMIILPWYYRLVIGFDTLFPGLVDWFLKVTFVKRFHHLKNEDQ
ncbi:MAG: SDR family NAD(P)-dependent oxidoreductase [Chloroflexota bacterium]